MTYPSPYQPPTPPNFPGGFDPYNPGPLLPARRASVLLYVLGALGILSAACCIGSGVMLPRMLADKPDMFRELQQQMPGVTTEFIRTALFIFGALTLLAAMGMIVLAPFVRQGSKGATIGAMILAIGAALFLVVQLIGALVRPSAQGFMGACMMLVPLVLFASLIVCLIQALGSSGRVEALRQQYAQQYWQSAYQQQMYRAGGGSGAIPPHAGFQPPPTPPPPPPQQQPPPRGPDGPSAQG